MPIAREANQRIEFFRAKRFLAVPEPEKEPLVVLPGETNILVHELVIMPFFYNQRFLSVEAWIQNKTRREAIWRSQVQDLHPPQWGQTKNDFIRPQEIDHKFCHPQTWSLIGQSDWISLSLDNNLDNALMQISSPDNNPSLSCRHPITSTQPSITQTPESG